MAASLGVEIRGGGVNSALEVVRAEEGFARQKVAPEVAPVEPCPA